jgi:hypothetical protein
MRGPVPAYPLPALLLVLSCLLATVSWAAQTGAGTNTARTTLSNQTVFTGSTWQAPRRDAGYPEVQELFKTDGFQDVYEDDRESVLRRFEIVFVISLPAMLLIDTLLVRSYNAVRHKDFNRKFDTAQNWILYGGSSAAAGLIAVKDHFDTAKWKKEREIELELWRGKF